MFTKNEKKLKSRVLGKIVYKFWSPRDLYTMTLCAAAAVLSTHDTFSSVSHFVHFLRKPRKTECMQWPNAMDIFFSFARLVSCVYILLLASKPLPSLHLLYKAKFRQVSTFFHEHIFLPWEFLLIKKLEIEKTKTTFVISVLKVVYKVVLVFFKFFNFFINKNSKGRKLSVINITFLR